MSSQQIPNIIVGGYRKNDEPAIAEIVYRTGFNGEDLTGRNFIDDQRLFFLMWAAYYVWYEPEHCFVAVDAIKEMVVGYILGTPDTLSQEKRFLRKMAPRLLLRLASVTWWRYPQTIWTHLKMLKMGGELSKYKKIENLYQEYPAHLHIDLLPGYQGLGIGTRLMRCFEEHLTSLGVPGVHLETTNHNTRAVPFYKKLGYSLLQEKKLTSHPAVADFSILTFAKKLGV